MKRTTSVVLGLLVWPALASAQNFDNVEIRAIPVTENIYMLTGSGGNIGVSFGDDGTIIVDDQFESAAIESSAKNEKLHSATQIIDGKQVMGYILCPYQFIVIDLSG